MLAYPAGSTLAVVRELKPPASLDRSPDGEHRGKIARVGDIFPLSPVRQWIAATGSAPSQTRPWGLRYARPAMPRAGAHEGGSNETTGSQDGSSPGEDITND